MKPRKAKISKMFQKLEKGNRVAVSIEKSLPREIPKKLEGSTGEIEEKKGRAYIVKISDGNMHKKYIIKPVHLKKLKFL